MVKDLIINDMITEDWLVKLLSEAESLDATIKCPDDKFILEAARSEDTRLNSSHTVISYAVFCLKKKILSIIHIPHLTSPVMLSILLPVTFVVFLMNTINQLY